MLGEIDCQLMEMAVESFRITSMSLAIHRQVCCLIASPNEHHEVGDTPFSKYVNCLRQVKRLSQTHWGYCAVQQGLETSFFRLQTLPLLDCFARKYASSPSYHSEVVNSF